MATLPPLNALRAFEAAARHLSFKMAACELNVTPAAISHQVKGLEEWLGTPLFYRLTRELRLTEAGLAALPVLAGGFRKLTEAVERMQEHSETGLLTISVSPSFGSMWLVPRLDRFHGLHPEIEIRIDGTDRLVDMRHGDADVAVRYGPGGYAGVQADFLFSQRNTPVCSPALLQGENALCTPQDLRHHTLLHVDWKGDEASWRMWLHAAGLTDINPLKGPHFTQEEMVVQAALEGQGVALIGDKLVADQLRSGRLVCPFSPDMSTHLSFSHYMLTSERGASQSKVVAFREWLIKEARAID
ncbi:MAG: transcriptional regulator GcvA [Pseudomonadota bacterium]